MPVSSDLPAAAHLVWRWLSSNGLPVLALVNLFFFACAILLAIHGTAVSRRLRRLAFAVEGNTRRLDEHGSAADASDAAHTAEPADLRRANRARPADGQPAFGMAALSNIRGELDVLRRDLAGVRSELHERLASTDSNAVPAIGRAAMTQVQAELDMLHQQAAGVRSEIQTALSLREDLDSLRREAACIRSALEERQTPKWPELRPGEFVAVGEMRQELERLKALSADDPAASEP